MKDNVKYYLILVVVSFFTGLAIQGVVSLLTWQAFPIKQYLFSGLFWAAVWPFVQMRLDKMKKGNK